MIQHFVPSNKAELIALIRSERQNLEMTISQLKEEQLIQPGVEGEWSVKDILAHLTTWEQRMFHWVNAAIREEIPVMPAPGTTWDDLDQLNQQTYLEHRDQPPATVLAAFQRSYPEVLKLVETLSEEDLLDGQRFAWREGEPLWKLVAANTCWHYKMHNQAIIAGVVK